MTHAHGPHDDSRPDEPHQGRQAYSDEAVELLLHDPEKYSELRERELARSGSSAASRGAANA
jgi:hypothetical protein